MMNVTTQPRLDDFWESIGPAIQQLFVAKGYAEESGLEPSLLDLVYMRASQVNGCALCVDTHAKDARAKGEEERRLYALNVWRDTPFFTERERAALEWTEAVTLITDDHVPDEVYERARRHFEEDELVNLNLAVATINALNRMSIPFRGSPSVN